MTPEEYQTALAEYGAVAQFAQGNAEVNTKLQEAIKNQWDAARFQRELWGTHWYQALSQNQRAIQVLQSTDPGEYKAKLNAAAEAISNQARQMGKPIGAAVAQSFAKQQLWYNWDAGTLQAHLGQQVKSGVANGVYGGQAGDVQNHVKSTLAAYGIPINDKYVAQQVNEIVAGTQTTGGFDNQVIGQASRLFPMYKQDFLEGRSLSDVAKPYIQQAATTLEIDPSSIDLTDKNIQKALHGDGKEAMPLWAFNQALKQDPRWQHTDNAKNSAYDVVAQIGKDWGFM